MVHTPTKVTSFPLTRERVTEIVRDIAEDSNRFVILVQYGGKQDWRKAVNARQIQLCLREGYVLDQRAMADENGNWRFRIARVCAGVNVVLDIALEPKTVNKPKLFVLGIENESIT